MFLERFIEVNTSSGLGDFVEIYWWLLHNQGAAQALEVSKPVDNRSLVRCITFAL